MVEHPHGKGEVIGSIPIVGSFLATLAQLDEEVFIRSEAEVEEQWNLLSRSSSGDKNQTTLVLICFLRSKKFSLFSGTKYKISGRATEFNVLFKNKPP